MFRLLIGSVFAAILMFGYGFVHWGVLPPLIRDAFPFTHDLAADSPVLHTVIRHLKERGTGTYSYPPYPKKGEDSKKHVQRSLSGPLVMIYFTDGGVDLQDPTLYIMGFVHLFVTALVLGMLMRSVAPALPSYGSRVCFAFALGIFAALFLEGTNMIWFFHPWELPLYNGAYHAGTALAGGLALALFIKAKPEPES